MILIQILLRTDKIIYWLDSIYFLFEFMIYYIWVRFGFFIKFKILSLQTIIFSKLDTQAQFLLLNYRMLNIIFSIIKNTRIDWIETPKKWICRFVSSNKIKLKWTLQGMEENIRIIKMSHEQHFNINWEVDHPIKL